MKGHPKYKGYYGTEDGNIISTKQKTPRVLKPQKHHLGYKLYFLSVNGKHIGVTGHRFIAECFIPNPDNLSDVNHIDEDKQNNKVSNLEWLSHKDNMIHSRDSYAKRHSKSYLIFNVNTNCSYEIKNLKRWCEENNVSRPCVYDVINGKQKMTKGFIITRL